ncbi:hypothetical protein [Microseira sp. BLCC-F43]|jgi:hypothetical protein|uniref:hypothetical protein n=1 Tax=Microseira sp. BLCC-F43 TaxID=3153602 RepID=UPI0035BB3108
MRSLPSAGADHLLTGFGSGGNFVTVQKLAGHSSFAVTSKSDRGGEEVKKKAVNLLKF